MENNSKQFLVVFSSQQYDPEPGQVVIVPTRRNWNDFGFHINCSFTLKTHANDRQEKGNMFIGFLPPSRATESERREFDEKRISIDYVA